MFIISNFLHATAVIINMALSIYMWIVIIRALISWVNPDPYNPIARFLYDITDPVLYRVRRFIPIRGAIDFSPIIVIFAIIFLKLFLVNSLDRMAQLIG